MNNKPKIILIILVFCAVISVFIIGIIRSRNKSPLPKFSGAIPETLPTEEQDYLIRFAELRDRCPVVVDRFTIEFNYAANKFNVFISEPYENNRQVFSNWLVENNFNIIPDNKFEFKTIGDN